MLLHRTAPSQRRSPLLQQLGDKDAFELVAVLLMLRFGIRSDYARHFDQTKRERSRYKSCAASYTKLRSQR